MENELSKCLDRFIKLYSHHPRQRSEEWLKNKRFSVGGSEIAALMGLNPYCNMNKIVDTKVNGWNGAGAACWWGTMLESAIERFVEIDLGTQLKGTDISIPAPGSLRGKHANSPDGYGIIRILPASLKYSSSAEEECSPAATAAEASDEEIPYYEDEQEESIILTTDMDEWWDDDAVEVIVLFEFKCPHSRLIKGDVPKYYVPQVLSGLALSPVAEFGIYVEAMFRLCSFSQLETSGYNKSYHKRDGRYLDDYAEPVAWGFTKIFCPENTKWNNFIKDRAGGGVIDFGNVPAHLIDSTLEYINKGELQCIHSDIWFKDGRGNPPERSLKKEFNEIQPPAGARQLGLMAWKIFEVNYVPIHRREGFLGEIEPLIDECLYRVRTLIDEKN